MSYSLSDRLQAAGKKRILALDGGGIRGALSLGYLAKIEAILRNRYDDDEFRLCQYFDLIGGTSTGSIIAGGLALGMSVEEIKDKYSQLGATIFGKTRMLHLFRRAKFDPGALEEGLQDTFGEIRLGGKELKTGICIFAKRVDTQSLWTLNNNPAFPYYEYNKDIPLWEAIRASAAAPTFFEPVDLEALSSEEADLTVKGVFTDGGVSPANNPALSLLMMTQIKNYGLQWTAGKDNLLIVSIGTGRSPMEYDKEAVANWNALNWASEIPNIMMADASEYNEIIMQLLSESPTRRKYDGVMQDLAGDSLVKDPLCAYLRYNFFLSKENLQALGGDFTTLTDKEAAALADFTMGENVDKLYQIGVQVADMAIEVNHFPVGFDVTAR